MSATVTAILGGAVNLSNVGTTDSTSKVVIAFCDPLAAWTAPLWLGERMAQDFPQLKVVQVPEPGRLIEEIVDSDVVIARSLKPDQFAGGRRLKWIHSLSTEVDQLADRINRKIVITSARDLDEPPQPKQALASLLVSPYFAATTETLWEPEYELIAENMIRFLAGRPLLNQVGNGRACKLTDLRNLSGKQVHGNALRQDGSQMDRGRFAVRRNDRQEHARSMNS